VQDTVLHVGKLGRTKEQFGNKGVHGRSFFPTVAQDGAHGRARGRLQDLSGPSLTPTAARPGSAVSVNLACRLDLVHVHRGQEGLQVDGHAVFPIELDEARQGVLTLAWLATLDATPDRLCARSNENVKKHNIQSPCESTVSRDNLGTSNGSTVIASSYVRNRRPAVGVVANEALLA
jgi:hypothetical protein